MPTFTDSATGGTYTTGAGGFVTGGAAASGGGINPATGQYEGGGSNNNTTPNALKGLTPQMTLEQAKNQAESAFSGIVAPMTLEDIRAREEQAKAVTAETATSIYNPQISREKQVGGAQVSTAEGVVGQRQGFNISTAEQAFVAATQDKVTDRIKEVENVKASYIAQGNLAAADRADNQLQSLNEFNTQMTIAKANYALQIMAGNREQAQLELSKAQAEAQSKQEAIKTELQNGSLKLDSYKLALDTPIGQTFEVNGVEYIGLKNAAGVDPSMISLSTDDKGYETGINKLTGEVLWKSKIPTGKTKTQAANVSITLNEGQKAGLDTALNRLEATKGGDGYYNTAAVVNELQEYGKQNPGKASQFLDIVKPLVNPIDLPRVTGSVKVEEDDGGWGF